MSARLKPENSSLRSMTQADLVEIFLIENNGHIYPWTEKNFQDCITAEYTCRVETGVNGVRGFTVMTMAAGEAHLLNLCVDPAYQQQGIGQRLLTDAMEMALHSGTTIFFLEVRPSNEHAIHLYEKNGFNQIGRRVNYYPTRRGREDALIFAKTFCGAKPHSE